MAICFDHEDILGALVKTVAPLLNSKIVEYVQDP